MIESLFLLDGAGAVMIEKSWRGPLSRVLVDQFWELVQRHAPALEQVPPIAPTGRYFLVHVQGGGLFFVAVLAQDVSPLLALAVLNRLRALVQSYAAPLSAQSVREHFMTLYHVVDEALDGGVPFTLEPNIVHSLIHVPTLLSRTQSIMTGSHSSVAQTLPEGVLSGLPWRRANVKYTTNEVYLDLVEQVDGVIDGVTGQPLQARVQGRVQVESVLSGVPDLTLKFAQPSVLEDIAMHPCVRLTRWERERVVSFIPPDGKFDLLEYSTSGDVRLPLQVKPRVSLNEAGSGSVHISLAAVRGVTDKPADEIRVVLRLDALCGGAALASDVGSVVYDEPTHTCTWTLPTLPAAPANVLLEGTFRWEAAHRPARPTLTIGFKTVGWAVSGAKVESLTLTNEHYNHFKGVKMVTRAVGLQVRV